MTAISYGILRVTTRETDLAVIAAFSLASIVMTFASVQFGLDVAASILS